MGARQALGPGTHIGGYVIQEVLGAGGMGLVYRAYHHRLQRNAAIKVLLFFNSTPESLERFEREAQTVAKLRHPHILTIFDFGELDGQPYMVTEFMANGSLETAVLEAPLAPEQAIATLRPLAEALDYAHSEGVIHRDVKPGNVFLDSARKPVLADFGLSKLYSQNTMTTSLMVQGTPSYIAPEQARGKAPTGKTDLYSLATMAYELLTGTLPFEGDQVMDTLYAQVNDPPPPPTTRNPNLPKAVDLVLLKGLAKHPDDRQQNCVELVDQLESALTGRLRSPLLNLKRTAGALVGVTLGTMVALGALGFLLASLGWIQRGGGAVGLPTPPPAPATANPTGTVAVDEPMPLRIGSVINVHGNGLDPNRKAFVGIVQAGSGRPISPDTVTVLADGTFSVSGDVAPDLKPGSATLVACSLTGSAPPSDLRGCAQVQVQLAR
jgi:serine/threonine-protein kinase